MTLKNEKLSNDLFHSIRKDVLTHWETGKDVNFDEAVSYQKAIPAEKCFASKLDKADDEGRTLTQPRAGVALPTS